MKIAIGILFVIGLAFLFIARWVTKRATSDGDFGYIIPGGIGAVSLGAALCLTVGWGVWRLFTS